MEQHLEQVSIYTAATFCNFSTEIVNQTRKWLASTIGFSAKVDHLTGAVGVSVRRKSLEVP